MSLPGLFIIAVGLSMDAFAVSVCAGLSSRSVKPHRALAVGLYFGGFQAAMPLAGYIAGYRFADYITGYAHWVAFILLLIIGGKMIKGSFDKDDGMNKEYSISPAKMLPLAVATSIDALAVGVGFAFLQVDIIPAVGFIGAVTFTLSIIGVKLGSVFGARYKSKAELAGGIILVLMGVKILLDNL